jgi:hypothetical protein
MTYLNETLLALDAQKVTLTFQVPTSGFTEDAATGNMAPNSTALTHVVWLKSATLATAQNIAAASGVDPVQFNLFGRAACCFPDTVRLMTPCEATCTYDGKQGTIELALQGYRGAFAMAGETFLARFVQN